MHDDPCAHIIDNLRTYHSGKWVNCAVAIGKLDGVVGFPQLEHLIEHGVVERMYASIEGNKYPLVRYVDHSWDRPQLKIIDGDKTDE